MSATFGRHGGGSVRASSASQEKLSISANHGWARSTVVSPSPASRRPGSECSSCATSALTASDRRGTPTQTNVVKTDYIAAVTCWIVKTRPQYLSEYSASTAVLECTR